MIAHRLLSLTPLMLLGNGLFLRFNFLADRPEVVEFSCVEREMFQLDKTWAASKHPENETEDVLNYV